MGCTSVSLTVLSNGGVKKLGDGGGAAPSIVSGKNGLGEKESPPLFRAWKTFLPVGQLYWATPILGRGVLTITLER